MNPISIPIHLLIPTITSITLLIILIGNRAKLFYSSKKNLWFSITLFLIIYLILVGGAMFQDVYCQWNLSKFDLNNDGFFSHPENTEEKEEAMNKVIRDTGRNFSVITGLIISGVISFIVYLVLIIRSKIISKKVS